MSTFVGWMLLGDAISRRSKNVERVLDGEAVVVMQNGQPDLERLRIERLTIEDLLGIGP